MKNPGGQKRGKGRSMAESMQSPGWRRYIPIAIIAVVALVGAFTLRDYLSFETLRDNRESLLQFQRDNPLLLGAVFVVVYVTIVSFSLPGAAVASVTGGFLFGLPLGTALNVISATIGASVIFLAARWGLGAAQSMALLAVTLCLVGILSKTVGLKKGLG